MKKNQLLYSILIFSFTSAIIFNGCSKGSSNAPPSDPCAGVTITVVGAATDADAGSSNGSITATASGSTGFTYSLNGGTSQTSGTFSNLAAGKYTITAKNANGCTGTTSTSVVAKSPTCSSTQTPGPTFTAVKALIITNCAVTGCHNGTQAPDYRDDCTIIDYADLIKQRAVDDAGTADQMPQPPRAPLAQADRDKITAWITAGKQITD